MKCDDQLMHVRCQATEQDFKLENSPVFFFSKRVWLSSFYLLVLSMDYVSLSVRLDEGAGGFDRNVLPGYLTEKYKKVYYQFIGTE